MRFSRRTLLSSTLSAALPRVSAATIPVHGAVPSARQLAWHRLEVYAFLHFTVNTFTDKEWGYGDEDPSLFNPTDFDANAIVSALKNGGMRGVILTCKHHDGFCLWPTDTTGHSVRSIRWRNGKADVVAEIAQAARKYGLQFGVYLSPWDRNAASYGAPEYVTMYRRQLRELLTRYGPVFEVWHDGANGGEGFYGGAREKRTIDKRTYYDWPRTWDLVRELQPNAVIFSDVGPDIRWVGNERGFAGETCWATHDPAAPDGGAPAPGLVKERELGTGTRGGSRWLPPECDVSIRPGWFWHEKENDRVKTPAQLMNLYYRSVGRGGSFLLNVPPDRRGLLHEKDVDSLRGFGAAVRSTFASNLAARAAVNASSELDREHRAANLLAGERTKAWAAKPEDSSREVTFQLSKPARFNVIRVREDIRFGQRVDSIAFEKQGGAGWEPLVSATSIGSCRLIRLEKPVEAAAVRMKVTQASAAPVLSDFGLFLEQEAGIL